MRKNKIAQKNRRETIKNIVHSLSASAEMLTTDEAAKIITQLRKDIQTLVLFIHEDDAVIGELRDLTSVFQSIEKVKSKYFNSAVENVTAYREDSTEYDTRNHNPVECVTVYEPEGVVRE
tara:strand:+ start:2208 stop:2567 length:360 start_codon:yes stop_codon:yes gene_type:complete